MKIKKQYVMLLILLNCYDDIKNKYIGFDKIQLFFLILVTNSESFFYIELNVDSK